MKKLCYFVLSLGAAAVIFLLAAAVVVGVTAFHSSDSLLNNKTSSANRPEDEASTPNADRTAVLLAVFRDSDTVLASKMQIDFTKLTVTAEPLDLSDDTVQILKAQGVFPFLGQCFAEFFEKRQKYIIFDGENFAKIADIYGGLVYNKNDMGEVLLTGSQAKEILTPTGFSSACEQLGEKLLTKNVADGFNWLANNTLNNLSYPEFFTKFSH